MDFIAFVGPEWRACSCCKLRCAEAESLGTGGDLGCRSGRHTPPSPDGSPLLTPKLELRHRLRQPSHRWWNPFLSDLRRPTSVFGGFQARSWPSSFLEALYVVARVTCGAGGVLAFAVNVRQSTRSARGLVDVPAASTSISCLAEIERRCAYRVQWATISTTPIARAWV